MRRAKRAVAISALMVVAGVLALAHHQTRVASLWAAHPVTLFACDAEGERFLLGDGTRSWVVMLDDRRVRLLQGIRCFDISPDGKHVALSARSSGRWAGALYDLDTSRVSEMPAIPWAPLALSWSPSGDAIAAAVVLDRMDCAVQVTDSTGGRSDLCVYHALVYPSLSWSADGSALMYCAADRTGDQLDWGLWRIGLADKRPTPLLALARPVIAQACGPPPGVVYGRKSGEVRAGASVVDLAFVPPWRGMLTVPAPPGAPLTSDYRCSRGGDAVLVRDVDGVLWHVGLPSGRATRVDDAARYPRWLLRGLGAFVYVRRARRGHDGEVEIVRRDCVTGPARVLYRVSFGAASETTGGLGAHPGLAEAAGPRTFEAVGRDREPAAAR